MCVCIYIHALKAVQVHKTPVRPGKGVKRKHQSPATPSGKPSGKSHLIIFMLQMVCLYNLIVADVYESVQYYNVQLFVD